MPLTDFDDQYAPPNDSYITRNHADEFLRGIRMRSKDNPIISADIESRFEVTPKRSPKRLITGAEVRNIVRYLRRQKYQIGSMGKGRNKGYYYSQWYEEYLGTLHHLAERRNSLNLTLYYGEQGLEELPRLPQ